MAKTYKTTCVAGHTFEASEEVVELNTCAFEGGYCDALVLIVSQSIFI
jgi:hypothetical protein